MSSPFFSDQTLEQALEQAVRLLQRHDPGGAERILAPHMKGPAPNPALLHMLGAVRLHQGRFGDGEQLLARARAVSPKSPVFAYGHAGALMQLGRMDAAVEAFRTAVKLKPDFGAAWRDLAALEERLNRTEALEATCRHWLRAMPDNGDALLSLSGVLLQTRRASDAEALLRRGLAAATDPRTAAALNNNLGVALRDQNRNVEALEAFDRAKKSDPTIPYLDIQRADTMQRLQRHEEARELYRKLLAAHPADPYLHQFYNDLLFRLGKGDDYLKSYDRAPQTPDLLKGKAFFLIHDGKGLEAHALYREILSRTPDDPDALAGAARALALAGHHKEAGIAFNVALTHTRNNPVLFAEAARTALQEADPGKAVTLCEQGLAVNPHDQNCLSVIGLGWRMMDDARDEQLSGYDRFVQIGRAHV